MGKGFTYSETLALISAQLQRIEQRLEKGGTKIDELEMRITRLEAGKVHDMRWVAWVGGVAVFALQIYSTFK